MTIYALSSGPGLSGLAVIRISGDQCIKVLKTIAKISNPLPRTATLTKFYKQESNEVIDEGIIIWFPSPKSYTGEDVLEFHVHGSRAVINSILETLSKINGCRIAEPGEFTKIALENGKIDLLKAESIGDLIAAETEIQRRQAIDIMSGNHGKKYANWREKLIKILSNIEAKIDFPEEDLPINILDDIKKCSSNVKNEIIKTLDDCGVDLIEIGMPFSDPIADGPVIQDSSNIAIDNGMNLNVLFKQLLNIRKITSIPIVLMGYINPVYQFGYEKFINSIIECDLDGLILPDLPLDDYKNHFKAIFDKENLSFISLITPNTSDDRIKEIDENSNGFIYMVSSSSITGKKSSFSKGQIQYFNRINNLNLKNPKLIGFGISDKMTFESACNYSNGAIIGTSFIKALSDINIKDSIKNFVQNIRSN